MSPNRRFARRSFLRGMAHTLDLGATLGVHMHTSVRHGSDPDAQALAQDWIAVGHDLRRAANKYGGGGFNRDGEN
jgi:hypothetical protein